MKADAEYLEPSEVDVAVLLVFMVIVTASAFVALWVVFS